MKLFLDTNVVIDFCGQRDVFFMPAAQIIDLAQSKKIELVISSLTFVNVAYILRKVFGKETVLTKIQQLTELCEISAIDENIIKNALFRFSKDFENSIQYFSAKTKDVDLIITRNKKDFLDYSLPVMTPTEFIDTCKRFGK